MRISDWSSDVCSSDLATWKIDPQAGEMADWQTLLGEGAVRRLSLSVGEVNEAFANSGNPKAARRPERGQPQDPFIDLYVAPVRQSATGHSRLAIGSASCRTSMCPSV